MRFSIRSLLAAMAYVALVAAAFATGNPQLADLIWAVSILVLVYAALIACFARGRIQIMALGFVALAVAYLVGLYLMPNRIPTMQIFTVIGYEVGSEGDIWEPDPTQTLTTGGTMYRRSRRMAPITSIANAIGTLAAGLIGCWIGVMAYKHASGVER